MSAPLVIPLGGGTVGVGAADVSLGALGVTFGVADVFSDASQRSESRNDHVYVKLAGLIRAGAGGSTTVVLSVIRADGSDELIEGTRLLTTQVAWARQASREWRPITLRTGLLSLRVLGHSLTAAGDFQAAALVLRTTVGGPTVKR